MTDHPAFCFYKVFEPEPAKTIEFERHYLLYAAKGTMRLRAAGRDWVLPPSRAAWLPANTPIEMEITQPITCCSVLYREGFIAPPLAPCTVFDISPLAREMILACQKWGPEAKTHEPLAEQMFATLAMLCKTLAKTPCNSWTPTGKSDGLKRALEFTRENLSSEIGFTQVAAAAFLSERSLARRFAEETGMTWRQVQRKMRMIRAMELLSDLHEPISQVALAVGYGSQSAFNSAFKEQAGQSPSAFRASG